MNPDPSDYDWEKLLDEGTPVWGKKKQWLPRRVYRAGTMALPERVQE